MLACFTFRAKPGKEREFEALLNDAASAKHVSRLMGATRNTLFLGGGRMVRVLEFPDGVKPVPLRGDRRQGSCGPRLPPQARAAHRGWVRRGAARDPRRVQPARGRAGGVRRTP